MARLSGKQPGPEASIRKILADEHGQKVMGIAKDLAGASGMLDDSVPGGGPPASGAGGNARSSQGDAMWHWGYLFSQALTVGGGTGDVQRNIVAEKVLGLPKEPNVERGMTWRETRHA